MLNKKLCMKCWDNYNIWNANIDWETHGEVLCLSDYRTRKITEPPPIKCPYLIEHILSEEDK